MQKRSPDPGLTKRFADDWNGPTLTPSCNRSIKAYVMACSGHCLQITVSLAVVIEDFPAHFNTLHVVSPQKACRTSSTKP